MTTSPRPEEPVALPPLVFLEQHGAELTQRLGRVVEQAEDHLAVLDREPDELRLPLRRGLELFGGVVVAGVSQHLRELEDVPVATGIPTSIIRRAYTVTLAFFCPFCVDEFR